MKLSLLLLSLLLFNSCKSGQISEQTGIEEIKFGNGGGFTGAVKTFTLKADGKLTEEDKEIKSLDRKICSKIFKKAQEIKDYSINKPENIYSFIEIKTKDQSSRMVWSYGSTAVDQRVVDLHILLMSNVKID